MMTTEPNPRIALWQGPSPAGDIEAAFAALRPALEAAAAMGARMLVAPELFLPGYNCAAATALAQPRGGAWHRRLAALARETGCGVTLGYAEAAQERVWNAAVSFDRQGREIAHYRKLQLYGAREVALFAPGSAYVQFDLEGIPAALLICYDIEFAPHVAALAARGVRLLLVPTANMQPFGHVARLTVPTMAVNHGVTIAYANYCGVEGDLSYCGGSVLVGPDGVVLARAGQGAALLVAELATAIDQALLSTQARDFRPVG